ncbi:hypothetical protein CYQ88_02155 [Hydrogenovibrio sp. SC-1]|uniref:alpha/beta hydrolase n=1 Tax=Hydrogenovibrio sp. SC-1 TaxID=2065820 RepID=UPI000C7BE15D|nr:alpha/beta fold hydrolase [Hydrogenovibrio sp. SC-1]PLA75054.1 hypothetical protein CYQ88_02155 [Hydrogenovibrio sp. SC-1]
MKQLIDGAAGKLQIRMTRPGHSSSAKWVVLSHPHPQFGGTMNNKVITTLERAFQRLGYGTLSYNFRGVEASEGHYDGGEGEQQDLASLVTWLRQTESVSHITLAGFSFGSYIALKQVEHLKADAICTVAPPVSMMDFSSIAPKVPWVLIQGGQDEVIDSKEVLDWLWHLPKQPDVYWRAEASHFFHGQLVWLKKVIAMAYH